jgi:beta-lactamase class A
VSLGRLVAYAGASLVVLSAPAAGAPVAGGGDAPLLRILARELPRAQRAAITAASGDPLAAQAQYEAGRDLQEALRAAQPVGERCRPLSAALSTFAQAQIGQAEGVDRLAPALSARARRAADEAAGRIASARRRCRPGIARAAPAIPELRTPRTGEAFFGDVEASTPAGATSADILVDSRRLAHVAARGPRVHYRLRLRPGRYTITVRFSAGSGRAVGRARAARVWLLPRTARRAIRPHRSDRSIERAFAAAGRAFNGYSGIWFHDLSDGRTAAWNANAAFPAASTVKLAVLVAALRRFGPRPERSRVAYDLSALSAWSSNLATNRLLVKLGGSEARGAAIAQQVLTRLGARSSTFTGAYRVGTSAFRRADRPPLVSSRVTTARDLGRILFALNAAAGGSVTHRRLLGLSRHEARVGLALLLSSEAAGDNIGLFRPSLPPRLPAAQKHGWLSAARHSAAVLYPADGPRIVVLLTYRPGITRPEAARLGRRVGALALR